jgi:hypothetical protein
MPRGRAVLNRGIKPCSQVIGSLARRGARCSREDFQRARFCGVVDRKGVHSVSGAALAIVLRFSRRSKAWAHRSPSAMLGEEHPNCVERSLEPISQVSRLQSGSWSLISGASAEDVRSRRRIRHRDKPRRGAC